MLSIGQALSPLEGLMPEQRTTLSLEDATGCCPCTVLASERKLKSVVKVQGENGICIVSKCLLTRHLLITKRKTEEIPSQYHLLQVTKVNIHEHKRLASHAPSDSALRRAWIMSGVTLPKMRNLDLIARRA